MRQLKIAKSLTHRSEESLNKYLLEIGRVTMLTPDEEAMLAKTIHEGGRKGARAKERLVTANLRFVVSVAKQYQNQGVALADLINEGNIGLIKAADKFDETRGFKFISYAIWWIRQGILQAIAEYSKTIRRPLSQIAISNKIKKATHDFLQQHQRYPSAEELSDIIAIEINKIEANLQTEVHVGSIDAPIKEDDETTFSDMLVSPTEYSADHKVDHDSLTSDLMQVLGAVLSERERKIVLQSFGIGCPERGLEDIGSDLGLTRERVRQIRERGIDKIRKHASAARLLRHLG